MISQRDVADSLDGTWIAAAVDDARRNLARYRALPATAPPEQVDAALDLCYEDLRARLTGQQLIRAVLSLAENPAFGTPRERP